MDLLTLLSLAGMNQVDSANDIYKIELTNGPEEQDQVVDLQPDPEVDELNDFLRLAGQSTDCVMCGCSPCECDQIDENQANYDYGKNPTQKMGKKYDTEIQKIRGKDNLKTRYTPARMADNPLTGEDGISDVKEHKTFFDYLKEVEEK